MSVRALTECLPISQPAVSQHLDVLRRAELVTARSQGASNIYSIDPNGLGALRAWLDRYWDEALANYSKLFEEEND